jgi:hypothetical protein
MKSIDGHSEACGHSDMVAWVIVGGGGRGVHTIVSLVTREEVSIKGIGWAWKLKTHDLVLALRLALLIHAHILRGVSLALALGEGFLVGVGNSRLVSHDEV